MFSNDLIETIPAPLQRFECALVQGASHLYARDLRSNEWVITGKQVTRKRVVSEQRSRQCEERRASEKGNREECMRETRSVRSSVL